MKYPVKVFQKNKVIVTPKNKITFKCSRCGEKSSFHLTEPLTCKKCGKIYSYSCLVCEHEFIIGETVEFCPKCGWFICPKCGSCGCYVKNMIRLFRQIKDVIKRDDSLKSYGFASFTVLRKKKERRKLTVKHFFYVEKLEDWENE